MALVYGRGLRFRDGALTRLWAIPAHRLEGLPCWLTRRPQQVAAGENLIGDQAVREVLENAARQIDAAFSEQPEIAAALRDMPEADRPATVGALLERSKEYFRNREKLVKCFPALGALLAGGVGKYKAFIRDGADGSAIRAIGLGTAQLRLMTTLQDVSGNSRPELP